MKKQLLIFTILALVLHSTNVYAQFDIITIDGLNDQKYKNMRATWGDFNNNGFDDVILISQTTQSVRLFYSNGDGTFTQNTDVEFVNRTEYYQNAVLADYNNDGFLDVFFTTSGSTDPTVYSPNILYKNNGDGTFTDVTEGDMATDASLSVSASWGDINNDGYLDLYVPNASFHEGEANFCYVNNGDGTFRKIISDPTVASSNSSSASHWIDINNDGFLDLVVLNKYSKNEVFINNQDLTFTKDTESPLVGEASAGSSNMVWLDINFDGYFEPIIFASSNDNTNKTFINNADGTFSLIKENSFPNSEYPEHVVAADLNNDGFSDLVFATSTSNSSFSYGIDSNDFEGQSSSAFGNGNSAAYHAAITDLTNNGYQDIHLSMLGFTAESNVDDNDKIIENNNNGNHWLRFKLHGTQSNRFGVGSTILAYKNGEITGSQQLIADGFNGSNQNIHFGLNQVNQLDSIVISWIGEEKQVIQNLRTDRINTFKQDESYIIPAAPTFITDEVTSSTFELNNIAFEENLAVFQISTDAIDFEIVDTLTNETNYRVTGLDENSQYYIKAISLAEIQYSNDSEIDTVQTLLNAPELTNSTVSHNSIEIFWEDNSESEDHFVATLTSGTTEEDFTIEKDNESFLLTGLDENNSYSIQLKATTEEGNYSQLSNEITAKTLLNAPEQLQATLAEQSIVLNWKNNSAFNTGFKLEKSESEDFIDAKVITLESNEFVDDDINTTRTTSYFYRVKAVNDSNYSAYNQQISSIITDVNKPMNEGVHYTNPVNNFLKVNGLPEGEKTIRVFDLLGKQHIIEKTYNSTFDFSNLPAKLYWVTIKTNSQTVHFKIVKK